MVEEARGMIGQRMGRGCEGRVGYMRVGYEREGEWSGGVRS